MNLTLLIDEKMADLAKTLEPHYNIVNLDYFKINGNLYLPSTIIPNVANYIDKDLDDKVNDKEVIDKLYEITKALKGE